MGRDVEIDVTANDQTGPALNSAANGFSRLADKVKREQDRVGKGISDSIRKAGEVGAQGLVGAISLASQNLSNPVGAGIIAGIGIAAAAAAPALGAALSGAVIGGAGGLGIIGGVILASRDPRIRNAGKNLGGVILQDLGGRSEVFIQPLLRSIELIREGYSRVSDDIGRIFQNASRFVEPLTRGAVNAVENITRGVDALVANAGPVIDSIAAGVEQFGLIVGYQFEQMAQNGAAAAVGIQIAFTALNGIINFTLGSINALTSAFAFLARAGAFGPDFQQRFIAYEAAVARATVATEASTGAFQASAVGAAALGAAINGATLAAQSNVTANNSLFAAQTNAAQAFLRAKEAAAQNGQTLATNSQKGIENRNALQGLAAALATEYERFAALNGQGPATQAVAERNRAKFIQLATAMTGSSSKANALANDLLGIPNVTRQVKVNGVEAARAAASTISATLRAIRDETVNVYVRQVGGTANGGISSAEARAAARKNFDAFDYLRVADLSRTGGMVSRVGGPRMVGEVTARVENVINLNGKPFFDYVDTATFIQQRRSVYRARYGGKYT